MSLPALPMHPFEYKGAWGSINGVRVLVVMRDDVVEAVDVASIREGVGVSREDNLWMYLVRHQFFATVSVDGVSRTTYLVKLEVFFNFCMLNPSPVLDAFRDELARIARSVQQNGSFIDSSAGPRAYVPPNLKDDPISQMCGMILAQRSEMQQLDHEVRSVRGEIREVRDQIGRGPSHWVLSAWVDAHGKKATKDWLCDEGKLLRRICLDRGIAIPAKKVSSNGDHAVRRWPLEAIKIWWPDCCRRMGWPLQWEVDV